MILLALFLLFAIWPVVMMLVEVAWFALRLAVSLALLALCVAWAAVAFGLDCTVALLEWRRERQRHAAIGTGVPHGTALPATALPSGGRAPQSAVDAEPPVDPPWLNQGRIRAAPWLGGWLHPTYQDAWRRLRRRRSRR